MAGQRFFECIDAQRDAETPPGLANCWECVFPFLTKPSRGRENGSTKLIPLPSPPLGPAAPLPYSKTRNLINSANFSIRFQDFQAEKGARKGDGSFFALVTPAHAAPRSQARRGRGRGLRLSSGINFHLGKLCPSPREKILSQPNPLDFHPSTSRQLLEKFHHNFSSRIFSSPRSNFFPWMEIRRVD